jgi:hypothetical protein
MGFEALPDETIIKVFKIISKRDPRSATQLAATDRRFHCIAQDINRIKAIEGLPEACKVGLDQQATISDWNLNKLYIVLSCSPELVPHCTPAMMRAIASASQAAPSINMKQAINLVCLGNPANAIAGIIKELFPDKSALLTFKRHDDVTLLHHIAKDRHQGAGKSLLQMLIESYAFSSPELTSILTADNRNLLDCAAMNRGKHWECVFNYLISVHGFSRDETRARSPSSAPVSPQRLADEYHDRPVSRLPEGNLFSCRRRLFAKGDEVSQTLLDRPRPDEVCSEGSSSLLSGEVALW